VVSFRGSVDIENWITNIDFIQTPYKNIAGAKVHEGFYAAYTAVSSQVISAVKALKTAHPTATYLITGHSLGGALATFAGVDIKTTLGVTTRMTMYTFGSPRTGNQAFTDFVF
jgi:predicted lipase